MRVRKLRGAFICAAHLASFAHRVKIGDVIAGVSAITRGVLCGRSVAKRKKPPCNCSHDGSGWLAWMTDHQYRAMGSEKQYPLEQIGVRQRGSGASGVGSRVVMVGGVCW